VAATEATAAEAGPAVKTAPAWLRYPQVTLVCTGLLFAAGIYALLTMPRREDPKITVRSA